MQKTEMFIYYNNETEIRFINSSSIFIEISERKLEGESATGSIDRKDFFEFSSVPIFAFQF